MVFSHDSVAILLYHTQLQAFLLVRQFRPPVYANILRDCEHSKSSPAPSLESAFVFELCAGLVDKPGLSLSEIASEEVMEETGYSVPATELRQVTSFLTSVGLSGSRQTIFAANIDEECLCCPSISSSSSAAAGGGGLASHGEAIDVVALPVSSVDDFLIDETVPKSAGLMFSLLWGKERVVANGGRGLF
jgi:UDP-sugar diphosphatase